MKRFENIEIKRLNGNPVKLDEKNNMKVVDVLLASLEQYKGGGFKVFKAGVKLCGVKDASANEIILEDAEFDGVKKALGAGPFFDYIIEQVTDVMDKATEAKITEVK